MKILNYRTDHSAGDIVYLLGNSKKLDWGKPLIVSESGHYKNLRTGEIGHRIKIEGVDDLLYPPEQFVRDIDWEMIDLAVFNLVYSNKNGESK